MYPGSKRVRAALQVSGHLCLVKEMEMSKRRIYDERVTK